MTKKERSRCPGAFNLCLANRLGGIYILAPRTDDNSFNNGSVFYSCRLPLCCPARIRPCSGSRTIWDKNSRHHFASNRWCGSVRKNANQPAARTMGGFSRAGSQFRSSCRTNFNRLSKRFPVVDDGRIEGILTQTNLLKALMARDRHPTITSAMQQNIVTVHSLDKLETAFAKLKECNCHTLPVTLNQKLVGLLTMDNLRDYLRIREASTG